MDENPQPPKRLTPARPHSDSDSTGYLPSIPWRYLLLGALCFAAVVIGYRWKENQKAIALRASILRVHDTRLASAREAYVAARAKLEHLIISAANSPTDDFVDEHLDLLNVRSGSALYMRIPIAQAVTSPKIVAATRAMQPDMIPSCLGLSPVSARGLYETGAFLLPEFVADLDQKSVWELRVQDDELTRHISADLPSIMDMIHARWFMLILEEGENRRDAPVRAFVWDLEHEQLLLRARVKSQGILITSHILSKGVDPEQAPEPNEHNAVAANDCSIAGAIKRLTVRQ